MPEQNLVTLAPESEEYAAVRCMLSNSTQGRGTVSGVVVQKVNCPEIYKRSDRNCRKKLKVIGWSNIHTLGSDNDAENISKRGFVLGRDWVALNSVSASCPSLSCRSSWTRMWSTRWFIQTLLWAVLMWMTRSSTKTLPEGYDSFYVPPQPLDRDDDGHFDIFEYQQAVSFDDRDPSDYEHKYYIKDPTQICPNM